MPEQYRSAFFGTPLSAKKTGKMSECKSEMENEGNNGRALKNLADRDRMQYGKVDTSAQLQ